MALVVMCSSADTGAYAADSLFFHLALDGSTMRGVIRNPIFVRLLSIGGRATAGRCSPRKTSVVAGDAAWTCSIAGALVPSSKSPHAPGIAGSRSTNAGRKKA